MSTVRLNHLEIANLTFMPITLPTQSEAKSQSTDTINAEISAANALFIASTTILINNAISNGLYEVQPFAIPFLDIHTITTYFQGFGYTVLFPASFGGGCSCSPDGFGEPFEPCFVAGFPEVLPPGYIPWNCQCDERGPLRMKISWNVP